MGSFGFGGEVDALGVADAGSGGVTCVGSVGFGIRRPAFRRAFGFDWFRCWRWIGGEFLHQLFELFGIGCETLDDEAVRHRPQTRFGSGIGREGDRAELEYLGLLDGPLRQGVGVVG